MSGANGVDDAEMRKAERLERQREEAERRQDLEFRRRVCTNEGVMAHINNYHQRFVKPLEIEVSALKIRLKKLEGLDA